MEYYSTKNRNDSVTFRDAVMKGMPENGGLYMPESIPEIPEGFLRSDAARSFKQVAYTVGSLFAGMDIPSDVLGTIVDEAFSFEAPLVRLNTTVSVMELFHGPTLAFKDFGASFMARVMSHFNAFSSGELTILAATSGDTGSAVAHAFYNVPGIRVVLLYPSGMVSTIQEKQLTTMGGNVTALEITGTFDDCQNMVKKSFSDTRLRCDVRLTSANSINIARLIPQMFYYICAYAQLNPQHQVIFSVPSGNLGNLCAGIFAMKAGVPVKQFVAANNSNCMFFDYLKTGIYRPRNTVSTISNAMDVGNPSNFERIHALFHKSHEDIANHVTGFYYSDLQTIESIRSVYEEYGYIADPHSATAFQALRDYKHSDMQGIVLETAHPAKFRKNVESAIHKNIDMPRRLEACLKKPCASIKMPPEYQILRDFLYAETI